MTEHAFLVAAVGVGLLSGCGGTLERRYQRAWHGIILPNGMDGVAGLNQRKIDVGETFKYEFTVRDAGTFMYHPHFDEMTQMALGMMGILVVHPRDARGPRPDRDFAIMLSEWEIDPEQHQEGQPHERRGRSRRRRVVKTTFSAPHAHV